MKPWERRQQVTSEETAPWERYQSQSSSEAQTPWERRQPSSSESQEVEVPGLDYAANPVNRAIESTGRAAVRGIIGGVQEIGNFMNEAIYEAGETINLGGFAWDGDEGFRYVPPSQWAQRESGAQRADLPRPEQEEGFYASAVEGISQFLTGYVAGGTLLKSFNILQQGGRAAHYMRSLLQGSFSDVAAFDPQDPMAVSLIRELGVDDSVIVNWLDNPDDTNSVRRVKRAIEGAGLGVLGDAIIGGTLRSMSRSARSGAEAAVRRVEAEEIPGRVMPDDEREAARAVIDLVSEQPQTEVQLGILGEPIRRRVQRESPEFAGNINLSRWDTDTSVKDFMSQQAQRFQGATDRVSWDQTKAIARELDMTEGDLRGLGSDLKDIQARVLAAREYLLTNSEQIVEFAKRIDMNDGNQVSQLYEMMVRHSALYDEVRGITGQSGRLLNQFRMMAKSNKSEVDFVKEIMDNSGLKDRMPELIEKLGALPARQRHKLIKQVTDNPNQWDAFVETYINSLLSGPQTHVVNMLSTAGATAWAAGERYLASAIGKVTRSADRVRFGEANAYAFGMLQSGKDSARALGRTLATGDPHIQVGQSQWIDPIGKIEVDRHRAFSREGLSAGMDRITQHVPRGVRDTVGGIVDNVGEWVVRLPGRLILAEDAFMKSMNYRMELNAQAYRHAYREIAQGKVSKADMGKRVRELVEAPPTELHNAAMDSARYITFTNPLMERGRKLQSVLGHPVAKLIFPFVRTPINIFKFAVERTPAAPFLKEFRDAWRKGGASRDMALAKVMMGSSLGALVAHYAADGFFTGSAPKDPDTLRAFYDRGLQPYSFIDKEGWFGEPGTAYSYFRFEPIGTLFGVASDFAQIAGMATEEEAGEIAAMISASITQNFVNKTYMQNLSGLLNVFEDPERYGPAYIQRLIASMAVPTGVAQYNRTQDPFLRRAETIIEAIKARAPGYSEEVAPHVNVWGQEVMLEGGVGPDIASPIWTSSPTKHKLIKDLWDDEIFLSMPERTIRIEDVDFLEEVTNPSERAHIKAVLQTLEDIELEGWDYNRFVKMAGAPAFRHLSNFAETPRWDNMKRHEREVYVRTVVNRYRREARRTIIMEKLRERRGINAERRMLN